MDADMKWTYVFAYKGRATDIAVTGNRHTVEMNGSVTVYLEDEIVAEMSGHDRLAWRR